MNLKQYFADIFNGVKSLATGMKVTGGYFLRHHKEKITSNTPTTEIRLYWPNVFAVKW